MKIVLTLLAVCLTAAVLAPRASADDADLARKALAVLDKNCAQCHGPNGKGEGHDLLDFILDVKKLTTDDKHYIVPGDPAGSVVLKKIKKGTMPPKRDDDGKPVTQRPSAEDVAVLEAWVQAGAPAGGDAAIARTFIGYDKMIEQMDADLSAMKRPIDRQHTRYFVLTALYNAGVADAQLDLYRAGLSKLVNSLSRKNPRIVIPKAIDEAKTIFRIDIRDYSWNEQTWNDILATYPYGVLPDSDAAKRVSDATGTPMPFLRGDWFVFTASRPPLYENILGIPTSAAELETQLGINSDDDVQRERVARAGFNKSGVSNNNRLLERHEFGNGAYYRSADFASNSDEERKNLFSHPLDYVPDGGEIIFNLPNGLQAYMLVDKDGNRIEQGPIKIVHDPDQPDKAVINGISCMSCHDRGMKEKDDEVRADVLANPNAFSDDEKDKILALYAEKGAFQKFVEEDGERFRKAVEKAGALVDKAEPVRALATRFEKELDLPQAAGELGLTAEDFTKVLDNNADLGKLFGVLKVNGGTVKREVWEAKYPDLVSAAGIGALQGAIAGGPVERLIADAKKALDGGDKAKALELYDKAVEKDPKSLAAHQGKGDLLFNDEKYADAAAAYDKAVELDPNDTVSVANRGLSRFRLGDNDAASPDLSKAIDLGTSNPEVFMARGDIRHTGKDLDGAVADYQSAIDKGAAAETVNPKMVSALDDRALDLMNNEKYADAIADLKKAHELAPKDTEVGLHLGLAHKANGDAAEALEDFKAVLELDEKNVSAYEQKADVEIGMEKYADAIDDLKKALDVLPDDARLHMELGGAYVLNGDFDAAIDEATSAIAKDPDLAPAYRVRASAYLKRNNDGDLDLAKKDIDKAEELEKDK